jgi:hypothetical protein
MGNLMKPPATDKEAKQRRFLQWGAVLLAITGTATVVYYLGYRDKNRKPEVKGPEGTVVKQKRKPFTPAVTSKEDTDVKLELKRKLTGYKGACGVTSEQLSNVVKTFNTMMDTRDFTIDIEELVDVARKMKGFEDQFDAELRLGAARVTAVFEIFVVDLAAFLDLAYLCDYGGNVCFSRKR